MKNKSTDRKKIQEADNIITLQKKPGGGSDMTLKKNISDLNNSLATIMALRPVSWYWKDKLHEDRDLQYGFIAQEVEKILPDLVSDGIWRDGSQRKFLTVSDLIPYLVAAVKEQQTQIIELKAQLKKMPDGTSESHTQSTK